MAARAKRLMFAGKDPLPEPEYKFIGWEPRPSTQTECEFCERSTMGRFQEDATSNECDDCLREFRQLSGAGKLEMQ